MSTESRLERLGLLHLKDKPEELRKALDKKREELDAQKLKEPRRPKAKQESAVNQEQSKEPLRRTTDALKRCLVKLPPEKRPALVKWVKERLKRRILEEMGERFGSSSDGPVSQENEGCSITSFKEWVRKCLEKLPAEKRLPFLKSMKKRCEEALTRQPE